MKILALLTGGDGIGHAGGAGAVRWQGEVQNEADRREDRKKGTTLRLCLFKGIFDCFDND